MTARARKLQYGYLINREGEIMDHPLRNIPPERRRVTFIVLLLFTMLVMVVMNITGQPLISDPAPKGIISYELAGNEETAREILESWDDLAKIYAGFNLGFDYLFLLLYSTTIAFSIIWLIDLLKMRPNVKRLALILATSLSLAALLDAVENAALFTMLVNGVTSPWPQVSFICATIKFGLVILGLAFVLVGFVVYLFQSRQEDS